MILNDLVQFYDCLDRSECDIDATYKKPDLIIELNEEGFPTDCVVNGKAKPGEGAAESIGPAKCPNDPARSSNVAAQLLNDKTDYVFGFSKSKEKPSAYFSERTKDFRFRNLDLLKDVFTPAAEAFKNFLKIPLDRPDIQQFIENLKEDKEVKGNRIFFCFNGELIQEDEAIWEAVCKKQAEERSVPSKDEPLMISLLSGKEQPIAKTHPEIRLSGQSAKLVSYNFPSLNLGNGCGRNQSVNSQIGKTDVLKYTKALEYLIKNYSIQFGDMTIIPISSSKKANDAFLRLMNGPLQSNKEDEDNEELKETLEYEGKLHELIENIFSGGELDSEIIDELDIPFSVIGLSVPIKARAAIRFRYEGTFKKIAQNLSNYYKQVALENKFGKITKLYPSQLYRLMSDPVVPEKINNKPVSESALKEKEYEKLNSQVQNDFLTSILTGKKLPQSLFKRSIFTIPHYQESDNKEVQKLTDKRTLAKLQYIKAYLVRNTNIFKGEDLVSLIKNSTNPAYLMGRIYAVIESTESKSDTNPYAMYYKRAKSCPAAAYPLMENKLKMRLGHDEEKKAIYENVMKQIGQIMGQMDRDELPIKLSLKEQGSWEMGYHHQREENIKIALEKKAEKEAENNAKGLEEKGE